MNLLNPKGWEWWQRIRSSFYPTEEESRFLGDPNVSPMLRDFEYMESEDLPAFHHDEHWDQMFSPIDFDGTHVPAGDESDMPRCGVDRDADHAHGFHAYNDSAGQSPHDHHSSWESDGHNSDWGSSWD
jgi:hypothetical protein